MTINQDHKQAWFSGSMQRWIAGSFVPDTANDPTTVYGRGFTVTRSGSGEWTVTLDKKFENFISIVVTGQLASSNADAHQYLVGDISVANRTFEIKHVTAADVSTTDLAAADVATSGTANKVNFICVVATSDVAGAGVP
jgi:hypothetical protein